MVDVGVGVGVGIGAFLSFFVCFLCGADVGGDVCLIFLGFFLFVG